MVTGLPSRCQGGYDGGVSGDTRPAGAREKILRAVLDLLGSGGWDAVQMSEVARRARVSLAKVYALFGTRDEMLVAALEQWMAEVSYANLAMPAAGESTYDGLLRVFRTILEPWESNPHMLHAFQRAKVGPGGQRLELGGIPRVEPIFRAVMGDADPGYIRDVGLILTHMAHAVLAQVASGEMAITDMLPALERAVYRLTADNTADGCARTAVGENPSWIKGQAR
jgi:TetR/AcrR family transcriptional regulator, cholesterol catabolism regulator